MRDEMFEKLGIIQFCQIMKGMDLHSMQHNPEEQRFTSPIHYTISLYFLGT